jgi:hypothetical protein
METQPGRRAVSRLGSLGIAEAAAQISRRGVAGASTATRDRAFRSPRPPSTSRPRDSPAAIGFPAVRCILRVMQQSHTYRTSSWPFNGARPPPGRGRHRRPARRRGKRREGRLAVDPRLVGPPSQDRLLPHAAATVIECWSVAARRDSERSSRAVNLTLRTPPARGPSSSRLKHAAARMRSFSGDGPGDSSWRHGVIGP